MMSPVVIKQLEELRSAVGAGAQGREHPDGAVWIEVPNVQLPDGWNMTHCTVSFLAPVGYPQARPDCFYADQGLRLASGGMPTNANLQVAPDQQTRLWFSYHVSTWDANRDSLLTYLNVTKQRLREIR